MGISNDFDMTHVARNANYQGSLTTPVPCFFSTISEWRQQRQRQQPQPQSQPPSQPTAPHPALPLGLRLQQTCFQQLLPWCFEKRVNKVNLAPKGLSYGVCAVIKLGRIQLPIKTPFSPTTSPRGSSNQNDSYVTAQALPFGIHN